MKVRGGANVDSGAAVTDDESGRAKIAMVVRKFCSRFDGWSCEASCK